jgi:hypothetical protein
MAGLWVPGSVRTSRYKDNGAVVFELGSSRLIGPYVVESDRDLPGKLALGGWAVFPDEWSADGSAEGAALWARRLVEACDLTELKIDIEDRANLGLTVATNKELPPSRAHVEESCRALKYYAEHEIELPNELKAKTGSSHPMRLPAVAVDDVVRALRSSG